ncbi:MAG TPA: hypothetical protein VJO15_07150 [Dehalococcoidia bacterium]|nr:hypothetical protein [Dehalococcoidia bacterium]
MAEVRDLAIIILAAIFILLGLGFGVFLVLLISLALLVRKKVAPILDSALGTLNTIEGTSSFVSDTMVRPMIRVASIGAGVGAAVRAFTRFKKKRGGKRNGRG